MTRDELAIEVRSVAGEGLTMTAAESVVDRLLPLIEADVRETIATEIEALGNERVEHLSIERIEALSHAARIVREGVGE